MKVRLVDSMGVYPHPMGISYAVFENAQTVIHVEAHRTNSYNKKRCIQEIEKAMEFHQPKRIIIRAYETEAKYSDRIREMVKMVSSLADERGIPCINLQRSEVVSVFNAFDVNTKQQRAQKMVEWFPEYSYLLPKQRTFITSEDPKMHYFDAMALVIADNLKNS